MANTPNIDLVKPAGTDHALVSVLNANSDKIDNFAGSTNQAISKHELGSFTTDANFDAAIISAIGSITINTPPYWISITHSFTSTKFNWAVYEGYILKGAGASARAAIVLTSGTDFIYGSYDGTNITWINQTKQSVIMSQTITVTTGAGGGVQLSNFTNYNSTTDTPLYVVIATTNADVYTVFSETSAGKPGWFTAKNTAGNVVNTSVNATMFWVRSV